MGKRSEFERNDRDYYPTPAKAVLPLIGIVDGAKFIEPCAGDGRLIEHIEHYVDGARCVYASDIEPQPYETSIHIEEFNLFQADWNRIADRVEADMFITNPPWINDTKSGNLLFSIINVLSSVRPTWLLLNGNFAFNKRSAPYMRACSDIVPIGRLKWIEDSPHSGKEDCAWFRFDKTSNQTQMTYIHPRG